MLGCRLVVVSVCWLVCAALLFCYAVALLGCCVVGVYFVDLVYVGCRVVLLR